MRKYVFAFLITFALVGRALAGPSKDAEAAYARGDYATAFRLVQPLADAGERGARNAIGVMCFEGHGVPQDYGEAVKWFRRAVDQGNANARQLEPARFTRDFDQAQEVGATDC